jgi:hypothetical protein
LAPVSRNAQDVAAAAQQALHAVVERLTAALQPLDAAV